MDRQRQRLEGLGSAGSQNTDQIEREFQKLENEINVIQKNLVRGTADVEQSPGEYSLSVSDLDHS